MDQYQRGTSVPGFRNLMFLYFSDLISSLARAANKRLPDALAASTQKSYLIMFRIFLAFLAFTAVHPHQVNVDILLAFLECLHFNKVRPAQMLNYVSALKSFATRLGWQQHVFDHSRISLYIKAVQRTAPAKIKLNNIVDVSFLRQIILKCNATYLGQIFKSMYLLAFFGFLRLSNMAPHSPSTFSQDIWPKVTSFFIVIMQSF